MYLRHLPFLFFTSVPGCGEESTGYQRDDEIHKQIYFLFVGIIEQFKRSYVKDTVHFKQKNCPLLNPLGGGGGGGGGYDEHLK